MILIFFYFPEIARTCPHCILTNLVVYSRNNEVGNLARTFPRNVLTISRTTTIFLQLQRALSEHFARIYQGHYKDTCPCNLVHEHIMRKSPRNIDLTTIGIAKTGFPRKVLTKAFSMEVTRTLQGPYKDIFFLQWQSSTYSSTLDLTIHLVSWFTIKLNENHFESLFIIFLITFMEIHLKSQSHT